MKHQSKYYQWIISFIILLVAFTIAAPVLADYLGPNRTVTKTDGVCKVFLYKCQKVEAKNIWKYKTVDSWLCSNESKPWEAYPKNSRPCGENSNEGYKYWEHGEVLEQTTITHPPATISGILQSCSLQNGWCVTPPDLSLSANEPLAGQSILLIEGTLNGVIFACPSGVTNCNVPLNEGDNNFAYWAISSWGDTSAMGTSAAKVDTIPPDLGLDISGASGANGWYVSPTTVTATGADATSGVASTLLAVNSGAWQASATLSEGVYAIAATASDNAGNVTNSSTTIAVDTTTPSVNVSVSGTVGNNGWYKSGIQVSALVNDATSGIATFAVSSDGAAYQSYMAPISFGDGRHMIQFKAIDNAGNQTETPIQEFYIDTIFPVVDLPASWQLGRNVPYSAQDDGSGLAALRIVIEDEDERYAKVAWSENVIGATYSDDIHWDGQFKDKTVAPPGTYLVWIKASDRAGNEHFELGKVIVPEPNAFLSLLPTEEPSALPLAPPTELFETEGVAPPTAPPGLDFGGAMTESTETTTHSLLLASGVAGSTPRSSSNILWGAAAALAIGAAMAIALEASRRRQEAEEQEAEEAERELERDAERRARNQQRQQENWLQQQALEQAQDAYPVSIDIKIARMEDEEGAAIALEKLKPSLSNITSEDRRAESKDALIEEQINAYSAEPQEWKSEYDKYMAQKALEDAQKDQEASSSEQEEKSWWQRTWEETKKTTDQAWLWVDQHQTELALGIGIVVGIGAIILSGGTALPLVAAAWMVGAAAVVAAGTVAVGTMALNNHYGREWHENLIQNVVISGLSAAAVAGVWFLFQAATTAIGPLCYRYQAICVRVEPVLNALDWGEEAWLGAKLGFQTFVGNDVGAAETAFELQMEHMDGGMPGNSVAKELGEEALGLVTLYGDDAARIIFEYGDDGIAILMKYGDDAIDLINDHGPMAIKVMEAVDLEHAKELLEILDDDVLDYVVRQSSEAVDALSRWSTDDLSKYGPELALRAKKDANVLAAVKRLAALRPIDPKHLTQEQQALIDVIAANSTQYGDEGQVVLGRWFDQGSGFVEVAKNTGSVHYNPHPDMWSMLGGLGEDSQKEVSWLINQQVVQTGIGKGLPFEYTLNSIPAENILNEETAVEAIFSAANDSEIMDILGLKYMPIRMKELQELQKAGYKSVFDEATNSYILILP